MAHATANRPESHDTATFQPYVAASRSLPEFTLKAVILGALFGLLFGASTVYLRCLNELDAAGVQSISSQSLAERYQLNAAQIRKDLAYFGEFGVRGVGYYVKDLRRHLRQILGLDQIFGMDKAFGRRSHARLRCGECSPVFK